MVKVRMGEQHEKHAFCPGLGYRQLTLSLFSVSIVYAAGY